jgi:hypothetical protein
VFAGPNFVEVKKSKGCSSAHSISSTIFSVRVGVSLDSSAAKSWQSWASISGYSNYACTISHLHLHRHNSISLISPRTEEYSSPATELDAFLTNHKRALDPRNSKIGLLIRGRPTMLSKLHINTDQIKLSCCNCVFNYLLLGSCTLLPFERGRRAWMNQAITDGCRWHEMDLASPLVAHWRHPLRRRRGSWARRNRITVNAAMGPLTVSEEKEQIFHGESSVSPFMAELVALDSFVVAAQGPMNRDRGRLGCRVRRRNTAARDRSSADRASCSRCKAEGWRSSAREVPDQRLGLCASGRNGNGRTAAAAAARGLPGVKPSESGVLLQIFDTICYKKLP